MSALFLLSLVLRPLCCCGHAGFWKCCHAVYTENLQPGITNKRRQWWGTVVLLSLHLAAPNALASLWELLTLQEGSTGAVKERLQAAPTQEIQSPVCSLGWIHIPREFPPLSPSFLLSPSPFLLSPFPFPSLSFPFSFPFFPLHSSSFPFPIPFLFPFSLSFLSLSLPKANVSLLSGPESLCLHCPPTYLNPSLPSLLSL